jgi:hypothetical protein
MSGRYGTRAEQNAALRHQQQRPGRIRRSELGRLSGGYAGFIVRGIGNVVLVLGLIPLVGAALVWVGPDALGVGDTSSEGPAWRRRAYLLLALTALCSTAWAHRRGASRWSPLWGVAGGAMTVFFFVAIALVLISLGSASDDSGCPNGRVYC